MIKYFITIFLLINVLNAETNLLDCDKIFEQRKDEILREMDKLDSAEADFIAYQEAAKSVMDQKKLKLTQKINELNATLQKVENTKKDVLDLYEKNKKLLEELKDIKENKIAKTYLKMKDKKAAAILDEMENPEAAMILFNLTPKKISKVMARMEPKKASEVTLLLKQGPPFDQNLTQ